MSKYFKGLKETHKPLDLPEGKAVEEEFEEFKEEMEESGGILHQYRQEQGWSLGELGEKAGLDEEHIKLLEEGKREITVELAKKFAKLFRCDYNDFLFK